MKTETTTETTGTTYRGTCACGQRFGFADAVTNGNLIVDAHRAHARTEERRDVKQGREKGRHGGLKFEALTAAERDAEDRAQKRRWAERLRDDRLPQERKAVYDKIATIASDLRRIADDVDRRVAQELAAGAVAADFGPRDWSGPMYAVEQVQHDVLWGIANLGLDRLVGALRDYQGTKDEFAKLAHLLDVPTVPAEAK